MKTLKMTPEEQKLLTHASEDIHDLVRSLRQRGHTPEGEAWTFITKTAEALHFFCLDGVVPR